VTIPTNVPFPSIPNGTVCSKDLTNYYLKVDATSAVNLASGSLVTGIVATDQYTPFPAARCVLG
jgi:hypothetical protein